MGRASWNIIKNSKNFYVGTYRKILTFLVISSLLNIILGASLYLIYFNQAPRDYYASNGVTPPEKLTAMDKANDSADALLAPNVSDDETIKIIPQ